LFYLWTDFASLAVVGASTNGSVKSSTPNAIFLGMFCHFLKKNQSYMFGTNQIDIKQTKEDYAGK
jgi:hypothetical protein